MTTKLYTNIPEAYKAMNQTTDIKEAYQVRFADRQVTSVSLTLEGNTPVNAAVNFKRGDCVGTEFIDLRQRRL